MVAHGNDVTIVECAAAGHYGIIYDAMEYGMIDRVATHPSGTSLINVSGMYILEI